MINIDQSAFLFLVPPNFKQDVQVQCVAFAIDTLFIDFIKACRCVAVWADSTNWNDNICDQLAVELRTPLYSQNLDLETKKEMIKKTLEWFKMLGTAKVTKEVTAVAWKSTGIEEWFSSSERQQYTFRIKTKNWDLFSEQQMLLEKIKEVKNVRSSLEGLIFEKECNIYTACYATNVEKVKILPYQPKTLQKQNTCTIYAYCGCVEHIKIKYGGDLI